MNVPHRLPGTDDLQEGGLVIKKRAQPTTSDDPHIFKVPQIPPSTSALGLDKLAAEKRRNQSSASPSKRSKTSTFIDDHSEDDQAPDRNSSKSSNKERQLREQRDDTPNSSRSSHHDLYDKSRTAAKQIPRGLVYGKDGNKQRRCSRAGSFVDIVARLQIEI